MSKSPVVGIGGEPLRKLADDKAVLTQLFDNIDSIKEDKPIISDQDPKICKRSFIPKYVTMDKKTLKFDAFKKESVWYSSEEDFRIRVVRIYYHLEIDAISVEEPTVENSGMKQGTLLKRQQIPNKDTGRNWSWTDLNVGIDVNFYGHVFHTVNCDRWTREFLTKQGINVNEPEEIPLDPYTVRRKELFKVPEFRTPSTFDKLSKFLDFDRKVLRFYGCVKNEEDDDMRFYVIYFYLVDDTIEILEQHQPNDGLEDFKKMLKRQKIFKESHPGFAPTTEKSPEDSKNFIQRQDIVVGSNLKILGRNFLIHDCDTFTKDYLLDVCGITDIVPLDIKPKQRRLDIQAQCQKSKPNESLTFDAENSLQIGCDHQAKDFSKLLLHENQALRYEAILKKEENIDERRFILSYWLADDCVSVFEPPVPNSGIGGGHFLKKMRLRKPLLTKSNKNETDVFYKVSDFHIGATIMIFNRPFLITDADQFVFKYMQMNPNLFPENLLESIKENDKF